MIKIIIVCVLIIIDVIWNTSDAVINKICFVGLQRISVETASFYLPLKVGNTINNNDIANSIKILFSTGYFETISVCNNDGNGVVTIIVKERPIINNIKFYGNKTISSEIVQEILDKKKVKSGEPLNNYVIFEVKSALQDICYSIGKFSATVKIISIFLPKNQVDLQIVFSEGRTAKVNQIDIFGNLDFSKKKLLKQFKLYNCLIWKNTVFNKQYRKQKFLCDLEELRTFYLNRGYAKFYINDVQINLDPCKENVHLSIYITEGTQYSIQSLVVRGNILHYIPEIQEYLQITPGELYNHNKIKEMEYNIQYILKKYGYIKPAISIEYDFDDRNKTIELYVYVDVNNRFYVREIRFEGNNFTKDFVIRREMQQMEQTWLNYTSILSDQERLQRLNYFKSINTRIEYVPNTLNQIDIIYELEERNTGNINCNIGFGTESRLNMQVGIYQENLLGSGNSISITATKNHYQTYVDALLLKRYLGMNKINIAGKIFYNNFFTSKMDVSYYNMKNYGIRVDCSYPVSKYITCSVGNEYISSYLSRIEPQILVWRYLNSVGIKPEIVCDDNNYVNNNIFFCIKDILLSSGWVFNNLNRMNFPEFGSNINIISKLTLPGSKNQYYKIILNSNHYLPLDQSYNWVLASNLFAGYAGGLYKKESPFYDNFYIGGIGTVRGFRLNSIGPKAAYYRCADKFNIDYTKCVVENSGDSVGGNSVFSVKNELIIPIAYAGIQYLDSVRISLFIDAGTVWDTHWKNTLITRAAGILDYSIFGHIRVSSGISLQWMSPIGPVVFSYAKIIKKYLGDLEEPFQFSIGKSL